MPEGTADVTALPSLWPFPAAQEISEVLEWSTDILQSEAGEQRIALRTRPREIITLRHRLDALGMAQAAELARAGFAGEWNVPLWHMALQPEVGLVQGATEILLATGLSDFRAGGLAGIAVNGSAAAPIGIAAVHADRLILAEPLVLQLPAMSVGAARISVMPIRAGLLTAPVEIARRRQGDGVVTASFLLRDASDIAPLVIPTYLGRPVQTDPSLMRGPLAASLSRAVEYVDNGFGPVVVEPIRDVFERGEAITLKAYGPAARWAQRRWLVSLRGRQASFWLPTWGRELQLRSSMTSGSVLMRVASVAELQSYVGRHIVLEMPGTPPLRISDAAIYIALDVSGSMSGARMAAQKEAVAVLIHEIGTSADPEAPNDICIVLWNSGVAGAIKRRAMGPEDYDAIEAWMRARSNSTSGGTNFDAAFAEAGAFFAGSGARRRIVFFVTDGLPSPVSSVADAQATIQTLPPVDIYGFNIALTDTSFTARIDTTYHDGVPVVPPGTPEALVAAVRDAVDGGMDINLQFRAITTAVADGPDHLLTLSSNLGEPVPSSTKVHFLTAVRSDADRVEIQHGAVASEVALPLVEVVG